ncbi:ABC transporter substrate-binding protein [Aerococcaceae bacterium INB8]|uniref:ABC transporter substrate-binding protein n=1 Tax=Ruoffia halotolerans TaxID=2748684 RepID=A0A839A884_9LACT|nr:ABC transporter substrate-binding protein [Ruoffia halotolerans]MBA5729755.1 ABC transporter substrate-binding protein [Ruoffia halotolerans]
MKQLMTMLLGILLIVAVLFGFRHQLESSLGLTEGNTIVFYNWGDYIDPELLTQFEEETGYSVIYETFDSNEAMMTKIEQGGTRYDVAVPSEYMIEQMIEADLLQEIDHSLLPNLENINPRFLDLEFDSNNRFSIPYFWGTLGIIYNTNYVDESEVQQWNDLWNPKFRNNIMIYDGAREVLGVGLQSLGYSLNETDSTRLREATNKMKTLMPNILALVADEMKMHLGNEEAMIGVTFSGEASMAIWENPELAYVLPEEGSNLWFDNIVIPHNAQNVEGAHALIDFLLRPEVAAKNADYVGYSTPNEAAMALMDPEVISDEAFYPSEDALDKLEVYRGLGQEKLIEYNDLFLEVKIEPRD